MKMAEEVKMEEGNTVSAQETAQEEAPKAEEAAPAAEALKAAEAAPAAEAAEEKKPEETMADYSKELEASYQYMGDGEHDTDTLLAWKKIEEYKESKEILTVEVSGIVNKGVIVMIEGIRGFIPASRLDTHRVEDLNAWLGKTVRVRVIECNMEKNKLILSAREILREEQAEARKEKIAAVEVGSIMEGTVESLQSYGAFVDLGDGLSGLIHISQISDKRIKEPGDVLKVGQKVTVKVIKNKDGKIGLSMKALNAKKHGDRDRDGERSSREDRSTYKMPKSESIGTSLGDLLKDIKL